MLKQRDSRNELKAVGRRSGRGRARRRLEMMIEKLDNLDERLEEELESIRGVVKSSSGRWSNRGNSSRVWT